MNKDDKTALDEISALLSKGGGSSTADIFNVARIVSETGRPVGNRFKTTGSIINIPYHNV